MIRLVQDSNGNALLSLDTELPQAPYEAWFDHRDRSLAILFRDAWVPPMIVSTANADTAEALMRMHTINMIEPSDGLSGYLVPLHHKISETAAKQTARPETARHLTATPQSAVA